MTLGAFFFFGNPYASACSHESAAPIALLFVVTALLSMFIAVKRPEIAMGLLIFVIPIVPHDASCLNVFSADKAVILGLLAATMFHCRVGMLQASMLFKTAPAMLFLAAASLLSLQKAQFPMVVMHENIKLLEYIALLYCAYILSRGGSSKSRERFYLVSVSVVASICCMSIIQALTGHAASAILINGHLIPRATGPLEGPNQLAGFILLFFPAAIFWEYPKSRIPFLIQASTVFLMGITLMLTGSRSGYIAALGAYLAFWYFSKIVKKGDARILVSSVLGFMAGTVVLISWYTLAMGSIVQHATHVNESVFPPMHTSRSLPASYKNLPEKYAWKAAIGPDGDTVYSAYDKEHDFWVHVGPDNVFYAVTHDGTLFPQDTVKSHICVFTQSQELRCPLIPNAPHGKGKVFSILAARILDPSRLQDPGSLGTRSQLWSAAIMLFKESPFTGIGAGNYELRLPSAGLVHIKTNANSLPLQILAEEGLLGVCATLYFFATILFELTRYAREDWIVRAVLVATLCSLIQQFWQDLWYFPQVTGLWWILLGCAFSKIDEIRGKLSARD